MRMLIIPIQNSVQAKVMIKPGFSVIKIPEHLPKNEQNELRNKLIKVVDMHENTNFSLKLFYKIGTPYLFINRKVQGEKTSHVTLKYEEL